MKIPSFELLSGTLSPIVTVASNVVEGFEEGADCFSWLTASSFGGADFGSEAFGLETGIGFGADDWLTL